MSAQAFEIREQYAVIYAKIVEFEAYVIHLPRRDQNLPQSAALRFLRLEVVPVRDFR
jgi:hypothetical protein